MYHKITQDDCMSVATDAEKRRLMFITPMDLMLELANRWCDKNGYKLCGYLGRSNKDGMCWDATKEESNG